MTQQAEETFDTVTWEEIEKLIKETSTKKALGKFDIAGKKIKEISPKQTDSLTEIANVILNPRHFPTIWKQAVVKMLPKAETTQKTIGQLGYYPR